MNLEGPGAKKRSHADPAAGARARAGGGVVARRRPRAVARRSRVDSAPRARRRRRRSGLPVRAGLAAQAAAITDDSGSPGRRYH